MTKNFIIEDERGRRHPFTSPLSWNELTADTLLIWAGICMQKLSLDHALRAALMWMCAIPKKYFFKLPDTELKKITPRLNFLFGKNQLTKWVIKKFTHRGIVYHGPADCLGNLKIKEFRRTEIYYQKYTSTGDVKYLRLLVATLYRPERAGVIDDDIRAEVNEHAIHKAADRIKGYRIGKFRFLYVKFQFFQAVLLNYEGCRTLMHDTFPKVFLKGSGKKTDQVFDLEEIIDTVAGGALGDALTTESINVYRFFKHLTKQLESAEKYKPKR